MNFEELIKGKDSHGRNFSDFEIRLMRTAYNLAIDEAVKVADNHYGEGWEGSYQIAGGVIADKIKELKQ